MTLQQTSILAETNPDSWPPANGGRNRTRQLQSILEGAGIHVCYIPLEKPLGNLVKYFLGAKYLLQTGFLNHASPRLIRRYGSAIARVHETLSKHDGTRILLFEISHPNNLAVAHFAKSLGYKLIAVPQNIESLAIYSGSSDTRSIAKRMKAEITAFRQVDRIFCISREEQWLLAAYGVQSDHLPYYPPEDVEAFLLIIRPQREATRKERFLIMGSFNNPPTAAGMLEQIRLLKSIPGGTHLPVDFAGSGTESLKPHLEGTNFKLHGTVDQPMLGKLLTHARAMLIHQKTAVGALTRIPEMMIAGVPVIANPIAARSAGHYKGVFIYESAEQFREILQTVTDGPFPSPARPVEAGKRLIESVLSLQK